MLDDSRNMPIVIEDSIGLSRPYLFHFRRNVVHKNVVRALQVVPLDEYKSARNGTKAFLINSVNYLHVGGVELKEHGSNRLDVFKFRQFVAVLDGHRRAAKGRKESP